MSIVKDEYGHWVHDDRFSVIRLPKMTAEGKRARGPGGEPAYTFVRLSEHLVAALPSVFDPTGLVPAACEHGLEAHPDPHVMADPATTKYARSWIRSRYLDSMGKCPVCAGKPAPRDMTIAADA